MHKDSSEKEKEKQNNNIYKLSGKTRLGLALAGIAHLPDAISITGGGKIVAGVGGIEGEGGLLMLLNGPDRLAKRPLVDIGFRAGIPAASYAITVTEYYYLEKTILISLSNLSKVIIFHPIYQLHMVRV
ncbi:MAG: hypothetical protein BGO33_08720 [Bacteroidia bacterium 43-41]|nr:MAG: hypothetical protein BGO33_08720 [Bacteroidia bacterium 43-41]